MTGQDLSRKVAPFDPQMVRDAASHYEYIAQQLCEMADDLYSRADEWHTRATDARLKAEHLRELLEEFPDGRGAARFDDPAASAGGPEWPLVSPVASGRHAAASEPRLAQGSPDDSGHSDGSTDASA